MTHTLYAEGWYKAFVANVTPSTNAVATQGEEAKGGAFPNIAAGDYVLIHVTTSSNEDGVRAEMQTELDAVFNQYGEDFYGSERWATVKTAYENTTAIISGKVEEKPLMGDANIAKLETIALLEQNIQAVTNENTKKLKDMGKLLDLLPKTAQDMTKTFSNRYQSMVVQYNALTDYQKSQLTGAQLRQIKTLQAAWGEDGSTLPEARHFKLKIVFAEGSDFDGIIGFGQERKFDEPERRAEDGTYSDWDWDYLKNDKGDKGVMYEGSFNDIEYTVLEGANYEAQVGIERQVNFDRYEIYKAEIEGAEGTVELLEDFTTAGSSARKTDEILWKDGWRKKWFMEAILEIPFMPSNDVTIKLYARDLEANTLENKIAAAKIELQNAYAGYIKADYAAEGWAELTKAYNDGLDAIDAAADEAAVNAAKTAAIAAMAAVKKRAQNYGSVSVIVENTTFTEMTNGDTPAFTGTIVSETIPLYDDTSMMTAVLDALKKNGFGWNNSGDTDFGITYLSCIEKDSKSLGEFDGKSTSGWMGSLNDWFVNEGFNMFSVSNGTLVDGDQIRVMFTLEGFGEDLGASWNNSDTG